MNPMPAVTLAELNDANETRFIAMLGHVFEHSPWIAAAAARRRPFASVDELHRAMCMVVAEAEVADRLALIAAHPDLVGRAALAGTLTTASQAEQSSAGLDRLDPEEIAIFADLNAAYRRASDPREERASGRDRNGARRDREDRAAAAGRSGARMTPTLVMERVLIIYSFHDTQGRVGDSNLSEAGPASTRRRSKRHFYRG
jgi:hypothetical protein